VDRVRTDQAAVRAAGAWRIIVGDIAGNVDKAYEGKSVTELADAPVDALQGASEGDAQHLKDAFNIKTVRDLGTNKYILWAQAISKLAS
jgi:hypothetical protein